MSAINTFLQKRKMHETSHGIFMVAIAYVLSFFMLLLGSDLFYNINTEAAGINNKTNEATQKKSINKTIDLSIEDIKSQELQKKLINPYGLLRLDNETYSAEQPQSTDMSADTNWLLGYGLNEDEYESILAQLKSFRSLNDLKKENQEAKASEKTEKVDKTGKTKSEKKTKTAVESIAAVKRSGAVSIKLSKDEISMLERIVEAEATGEDMKGRILVANVIFNRIANGHFPDTVKGVIFQQKNGDYQFSPVEDERFWSVNVTEKTKEAVKRAINGEDYSDGALYFMARKRTSKNSAAWFDQNLSWLFKHGGHEFYK